MNFDPAPHWPDFGEPVPATPQCLWVKITQLLGEVSCYLQPFHDGAHCSVDWMEWM
jgi:hypothetical protein